MKRYLIIVLLICMPFSSSMAQEWMTSLDIAKRLALTQNKMVFMMWEEATYYPLPVIFKDETGKSFASDNLFGNETINTILWEYFVPVVVSENQYPELYKDIKGKRSISYIERFNDDFVKILDPAGTIINKNGNFGSYLYLNEIIERFALNTSYLKQELTNYSKEKDFYSAYFLASRYMDFAIFNNQPVRDDILNLSKIYLKNARVYLVNNSLENEPVLAQRADLLELKSLLISNRPRKVLRKLNRVEETEIEETNVSMIAFLYYTAYQLLDDQEGMDEWKEKVGYLNIQKAQMIVNINQN